jgi:hypothetical protein
MADFKTKLRIGSRDFYLISSNYVPIDRRMSLYKTPVTRLDDCLPDMSCMQKIRDFVRKAETATQHQTMSDREVLARAKDLASGSSYFLVTREDAMVPNETRRVINWIRKAITSGSDPYSYLSQARNHYQLDTFDDNLPAAERYFEGYDGNYNKFEITGSAIIKGLREVRIGDFKPFEEIFGRNGSKSIEFVTRWGMLGAFDRENGITAAQRVERESRQQASTP